MREVIVCPIERCVWVCMYERVFLSYGVVYMLGEAMK